MSTPRVCWAVVLSLLGLASARLVFSQPAVPATAPADAAPGVKLAFHPHSDGHVVVDARIARLIALAVPEGSTVSPMLPPRAFRATFEGFINLRIRGDYTFSAHGAGECEVIINGQSVLVAAGEDLQAHRGAKVRLKKGLNSIAVRYTSPAQGPARLRLYWAERDQPAEPVPPTVLMHDPSDPVLRRYLSIRAGRELFVQYRCGKCHALDSAMPEAQMDAPLLDGIGARLKPQWMARWIHHPRALRPDASMPRLFGAGDAEVDARAADIAAYLARLGEAPPPLEDDGSSAGARGAELFAGLGCVACHTLDEADDDGEATRRRMSLSHVGAKWYVPALVEYLRDPYRHYSWNPMPDFQLTAVEARQLAAYIAASTPREAPSGIDLSAASAERGRELVLTSGCLNCHGLQDERSARARTAIAEPLAGCLATNGAARGRAPDLGLNQGQRESLLNLLEAGADALLHDTPVDFADRQIRALNCVSCHALDAQTDTWSNLAMQAQASAPPAGLAADEIAGDQSRPALTWLGEKLHTPWTAKFIGGGIGYKPRPWLVARMPSLGIRATAIAEGMALQHGILPEPPPRPQIDEALAEMGRRLVGKENGFSCVTCHAIGSTPAISPFEAFGPNFAHTSERMRHDFYTRWVRNPQRYEPGTRMPQFADIEGKTSFRDVFDGDAAQQFEAIWHYLQKAEQMEPPEP